jgi:hypothetical protein
MSYEISKEALETAKKEYPEAKRFTAILRKTKVEVICRPPNRVEWRKFKFDLLSGGQAAAGANEQLFISCCVVPKPGELDGLMNKFSAMADVFGTKCRELGGSAVEVTESDL